MRPNRAYRDFFAGRFGDHAAQYDLCRPAPPENLATILCSYAGTDRPGQVIDLGCGTGLSTRYWADRAEHIIGIDLDKGMLRQAANATRSSNIAYVVGAGHRTGLASGCADIVVCANSMHWMEAAVTLQEIGRVLRPGGVLAIFYHNQFPLTMNPAADSCVQQFIRQVMLLDSQCGDTSELRQSRREDHLADMQASGEFRFAVSLNLHRLERGDAGRMLLLVRSNGYVRSLQKAGISDTELGLDRLQTELPGLLGEVPGDWLWQISLWVGVK